MSEKSEADDAEKIWPGVVVELPLPGISPSGSQTSKKSADDGISSVVSMRRPNVADLKLVLTFESLN